ncbi:MAG: helix-turn-helix transcriptional regulator [Ignavibacteriae bacterium]|nr:helix-turn-helix transcriptional regulator [Ignavibacteriota bacterium]
MSSQLDTEKLATMLKTKRGTLGLRGLAYEIGGVSASTLSRIEQGKLPDIDTFLKVCEWLEVSPDFFSKNKKGDYNTKEKVVAHLRADKNLSQETAEAIIHMIKMAYNTKVGY